MNKYQLQYITFKDESEEDRDLRDDLIFDTFDEAVLVLNKYLTEYYQKCLINDYCCRITVIDGYKEIAEEILENLGILDRATCEEVASIKKVLKKYIKEDRESS